MATSATIPQQLAEITVRLLCKTASGETAVGTGFFFELHQSGRAPVIITNRHVVDGAETCEFLFAKADSNGKSMPGESFRFEVSNFANAWKSHPDSTIDLAAIPYVPIATKAAEEGNGPIFFRKADPSFIPSPERLAELSAFEEILMVGYPIGLADIHNNMPIFRKGITATHPSMNYDGRREFLIDAACFPGSSGSPVFRYVPPMQIRGGGIIKVSGGEAQLELLGILYAGPQFDANGAIKVVTIPTRSVPISVTRVFVNLGNVIRSERLLEFKTVFGLQ